MRCFGGVSVSLCCHNNNISTAYQMAKKILDTGIIVGGARKERVSTSFRSPDEQQKIAEFLSTIDEKLDCEKNILNELTELKKGLLQRIFKEESKTLFKSKDGE